MNNPTFRRGTTVVPGREQGDGYLPLAALAVYAGLSKRTLRNYLAHPSRPLPHYRIGGKILVKRSEFDAWATTFRATSTDRLSALVADAMQGL